MIPGGFGVLGTNLLSVPVSHQVEFYSLSLTLPHALSPRSAGGSLSQRTSEDPGGDGAGEERAHFSSTHLLL